MRRPCLTLIVFALLAAPALGQDAWSVTGRDDRLWLLRVKTDGFDVYTRSSGGEWKPVGDGFSGGVLLTLAGPNRLHVFFAQRQFATIDTNGNLLPGPRLPARPLAACYAPPKAEGERPRLLLLARSTQPATPTETDAKTDESPAEDNGANHGPGTEDVPPAEPPEMTAAPRPPSHLAVYELAGDAWTELLALPATTSPPLPDPPVAWSLAATANRLAVAIQDGDDAGKDVLLTWDAVATGSPSSSSELPQAQASIHTVAGKLVSVGRPTDSDTRRSQLRLRTLTPDGNWGEPQTFRRDGQPMAWPRRPKVATTGEQLLLLWQDGDALNLAAAGLDGEVLPPEVVSKSIDAIPDTTLVANIEQGFFIALVVLLVFVAFVWRGKDATKLFVLPPMLIPGSLLKRAVAALVDFGPFVAAVSLYIRSTHTQEQLETAANNPEAVTPGLALSVLIAVTAYVFYGVIAEAKFGRTLGKRLMRLQVVGNGGRKADIRSVLLRNLMKIFELATLTGPMRWFFFFMAAFPLFGRYRQRLGDYAGRTTVVESRAIRLPSGAVARTDGDAIAKLQQATESKEPPPIPPEIRAPGEGDQPPDDSETPQPSDDTDTDETQQD
ncbi:MAG: hypothetical protein GVY16_03290 [Planctomycetes bacterium]|jgi:uncharacterized RDD family membrane protein YckC|nr:RDD family protein [Phycisphaerae bacterium]NBB94744.1 hypothetical protein [Planctomycetota bacterium]